MSQRTIVEFNHDYAADIKDRQNDFMQLLRLALNGAGKEHWDELERKYGVHRIVQCRHSDDRSVTLNSVRYSVG